MPPLVLHVHHDLPIDEATLPGRPPAGRGSDDRAGPIALLITGWTQRKRRHHGKRAIVRHRANNGEARAAVGTVDKRITITPFAWGIHFGKASRASGGIGNNLRIHGAACALADGELGGQLWPDKRLTLDAINTRQWRTVLMQLNKKRFRVFQQPTLRHLRHYRHRREDLIAVPAARQTDENRHPALCHEYAVGHRETVASHALFPPS